VVGTAAREGIWRGESTLVDRNGYELSVDQIVVAHNGADGSVEFLSTVARDLSVHKQVKASAAPRDAALAASAAAQSRAVQQAAVANLGGQVLSGTDLGTVMDGAAAAVAAGVDIDSVAIFRVDADGALIAVAATGCVAAVVGHRRFNEGRSHGRACLPV
jgi:hypothetical protein